MITVPLYLVVGQAVLLGFACFVLASAYRRLGQPTAPDHRHSQEDEATRLAGTPLPDLGSVVGPDGQTAPAPRATGAGARVLLVYVLPGCETCQSALEQLRSALRRADRPVDVHVLSVGGGSRIDAYDRFGFPVWRSDRNVADIFALKVYPVFLAVDETGMIRSAGSAHDPDALQDYLAMNPRSNRSPHDVVITSTP